jgi:hypothetical protein
MNAAWPDMTDHEKLESLQRQMHRLEIMLSALLTDFDATWTGMQETRTELGRINKEVATLRALWPSRYAKTG